MVVFDDQTLIKAQKRSPHPAGYPGRGTAQSRYAGPQGDRYRRILFDQPQAEDNDLIAALRAMKTPVSVGYANLATNEGDIVYEQQKFLDSFMARLKGSRAKPGSVRLDDNYGVTRRFPTIVKGLPPVLGRDMLIATGDAAKIAPRLYRGDPLSPEQVQGANRSSSNSRSTTS